MSFNSLKTFTASSIYRSLDKFLCQLSLFSAKTVSFFKMESSYFGEVKLKSDL